MAIEGEVARLPLHDGAGAVIAHATVDAEDAARLGRWRWSLHRRSGTPCRPARRPDGRWKTSYLRREILGLGPGDRRQVIHLNGDPLDCRRANLRAVTAPRSPSVGRRVGGRRRTATSASTGGRSSGRPW